MSVKMKFLSNLGPNVHCSSCNEPSRSMVVLLVGLHDSCQQEIHFCCECCGNLRRELYTLPPFSILDM